jgi:hypothetical protein
MGINRASYWNYFSEEIKSVGLFELNKKESKEEFILTRELYPNYFSNIQEKTQIVASDVFSNQATKELCTDYATKNKICSLLDTPVIINGKLTGLICLETTDSIKLWIMRHQLCPVYFRHNYGRDRIKMRLQTKSSSL